VRGGKDIYVVTDDEEILALAKSMNFSRPKKCNVFYPKLQIAQPLLSNAILTFGGRGDLPLDQIHNTNGSIQRYGPYSPT
jgi:hypothetical protein